MVLLCGYAVPCFRALPGFNPTRRSISRAAGALRCAPLRVAVGGTAPRAHAPRPHPPTFARTLRPHLTIYMDAVLGRAGVGGRAVVYDGLGVR